MGATGTAAAGTESIPTGAAAVIKIFRVSTGRAKPAVRWLGLPFAQRAANAREIGLVFGPYAIAAARIFDREFFPKQQED
jgi:hypothetical protein